MKINCLKTAALVVLTVVSSTASQAAEHGYKLTFDKPANTWTEAVPVGNGRIGVMVFGGTEHERLQINESTLWGGAPHDYINQDAYSHLDEVRKLIFAGRVD